MMPNNKEAPSRCLYFVFFMEIEKHERKKKVCGTYYYTYY